MKKLFSTILAATMLFAFGCSKQDANKVTIDGFANAIPETTEVFIAWDANKELSDELLAQKGAKEFILELTKNQFVQNALNDFFNIAADNDVKEIFSVADINKFITEFAQAGENSFFGIYVEGLFNDEETKFSSNLLIKSALFTQAARDVLDKVCAKNKLQKSEKDGSTIYKASEDIIVLKGDMFICSETEESINTLLKNLKTPLEKSFAKTQNYAKLNALKPNADLQIFFDAHKISNGEFGSILFACKSNSINEADMALKFELGKNAIKEAKDTVKTFAKRTLAKGGLLKNSMKDSSFALGIAVPELSKDLVDLIAQVNGANDPSTQMILQMLKVIDLKSLYLSCGDLDFEKLMKIQETMQPPEMFLKIDCANADAFFKNPMMGAMLNSPFISPLQVGENKMYTTMANVKFASFDKTSAFVSTMTDLAKTTDLAKNKGETLSSSKNTTEVLNKLPEGNQIEAYFDGKKLEELSYKVQEMQTQAVQAEAIPDMKKFIETYNKINSVFKGIIKRADAAASLKFEDMAVILNLVYIQDIDFEKALKQLKELK